MIKHMMTNIPGSNVNDTATRRRMIGSKSVPDDEEEGYTPPPCNWLTLRAEMHFELVNENQLLRAEVNRLKEKQAEKDDDIRKLEIEVDDLKVVFLGSANPRRCQEGRLIVFRRDEGLD